MKKTAYARILTACLSILLLTLLMTAAAIPAAAVDLLGLMTAETYKNDALFEGAELPYRIYVPAVQTDAASCGVLLWLHDEDGRGDDNVAQIQDETKAGLINAVVNDPDAGTQYIIVAPQCPAGTTWTENDAKYLTLALDLLREKILKTEFPQIDPNRILIGGLSMGATAGYTVLAAQGTEGAVSFAGACLVGGTVEFPSAAAAYAKTKIFAFVSDTDTVTPPDSVLALGDALKEKEAPFYVTNFPDAGHDLAAKSFADTYLLENFPKINLPQTPADTEAVTTEAVTAPVTEPPKPVQTEAVTTEAVTEAPLPSIGGLQVTSQMIAYVILAAGCILSAVILITGAVKIHRGR